MLNHTRNILLAAVVAVLAMAPVAAAKKTIRYSSSISSAPVTTANGYPAPGGTADMAGSLKSDALGPGIVIDHVTVTGQPQPGQFAFKGTEVDLFSDGALGNTFTGTATVNADGSQSVVINGRFTPDAKPSRRPVLFGPASTGRYRGATGSYTFTGTVAPGSNLIVGSSSGSVAY
jgi:hypothetical protein